MASGRIDDSTVNIVLGINIVIIFSPTSTKPQDLNIVLSKVWLQWRQIGVESVE